MKYILVFVLSAWFVKSYAQKNFQPGYIVTNNNDTIRGNLKTNVEEGYTKGIIFSQNTNAPRQYNIDEIKSFGFNGGVLFRTVSYTNQIGEKSQEKHFAKLLFSGTNDVFSFYKKDKLFFVVNTKDSTTYFLYNDITSPISDVVEHGNYQQFLFLLSNGCSAAQSGVERVFYNESSIVDYFKTIEKCFGNSNTKIFYAKPKAETQIHLFAGGMAFKEDYEISAQLFARFYFKSHSRKTSLNVGFSYYHTKEDNTYPDFWGFTKNYKEIATLYEVPLTMQYDIFSGAFRPYITGGFGLAYLNKTPYPVGTNYEVKPPKGSFGFTVIGGAGIEANITSRLIAKVDWRYNFSIRLPVIGIAYRFR
jgi:opacity protein-like surface antigen